MYNCIKDRGYTLHDIHFAEEGEYCFRFEFLEPWLTEGVSSLVVGDTFVFFWVIVRVTIVVLVILLVIIVIIVVGVATCIVYSSGSILYISSPIIVCGNTCVTREILPNTMKIPLEPIRLSHCIICLFANHTHRYHTRIQIRTVVQTLMLNHLLNYILLLLQRGTCPVVLVQVDEFGLVDAQHAVQHVQSVVIFHGPV